MSSNNTTKVSLSGESRLKFVYYQTNVLQYNSRIGDESMKIKISVSIHLEEALKNVIPSRSISETVRAINEYQFKKIDELKPKVIEAKLVVVKAVEHQSHKVQEVVAVKPFKSEIHPFKVDGFLKGGSKDLINFDLESKIQEKVSHKQELHEFLQKKHLPMPVYKGYQVGPDHIKKFGCLCVLQLENDELIAKVRAEYKSKILAEQASAKKMLKKLMRVCPQDEPEKGKVQSLEYVNYKGQLQEYCMARGMTAPVYMIKKIGEDHAPQFTCYLELGDNKVQATEFKKKDSERECARLMLELLGELSKRKNFKNTVIMFFKALGIDPIFKSYSEGPSHSLVWITIIQAGDYYVKSEGFSVKRQSEEDACRKLYSLIKDNKGVTVKEAKQVVLKINQQHYAKYVKNDIIENDDDDDLQWCLELEESSNISLDDPLEKMFSELDNYESDDDLGDEILFSPSEYEGTDQDIEPDDSNSS
jgi:dsRNA-specific ribonuclease